MSINQTHAPHVTAIELTGEYTTTLGQPPVSAVTCTSRTPIAVSIRSWRVLPSSSLPPRSSPSTAPSCWGHRPNPHPHVQHSSPHTNSQSVPGPCWISRRPAYRRRARRHTQHHARIATSNLYSIAQHGIVRAPIPSQYHALVVPPSSSLPLRSSPVHAPPSWDRRQYPQRPAQHSPHTNSSQYHQYQDHTCPPVAPLTAARSWPSAAKPYWGHRPYPQPPVQHGTARTPIAVSPRPMQVHPVAQLTVAELPGACTTMLGPPPATCTAQHAQQSLVNHTHLILPLTCVSALACSRAEIIDE
jgi:hypothetical protein